jgi:hypothetical protein
MDTGEADALNNPPYGEQETVDDTFENTLSFEDIMASDNWQPPGEYYRTMPSTTRSIIQTVVQSDERIAKELREIYLPELLRNGSLLDWGQIDQRYIEALQRKYLYTGRVVAADGTLAKYETLSLVGAQIAITTVGYQGTTAQIVSNMMHWGKEIPRKTTAADIVKAVRSRGKELKEHLPNLFLYALMLYKERELLLNNPPGTFKLIHGPVFPYEMLTGSGKQHILQECLQLLQALIDDGSYAAIVSKAPQRELLALGMALRAGEYIIVNKGTTVLDEFLKNAHFTTTKIDRYGGKSQIQVFDAFQRSYGSKVVQGVLRAHPMSPPYVFYCNNDQIPTAVHMLFADAANSGPRGFPLLIDLADQICSGAFKASEYTSCINAEFTRASGGSGLYQSERTTRD